MIESSDLFFPNTLYFNSNLRLMIAGSSCNVKEAFPVLVYITFSKLTGLISHSFKSQLAHNEVFFFLLVVLFKE